MGLSLLPQHSVKAFTDITPSFLNSCGIKLLMLDLDNTIAKYSERTPSESVMKWVRDIKSAGIELFIVSNSRKAKRVDDFAAALQIGFTKNARKPSPRSLLQTMTTKGFHASQSAMLGDQIFTDTFAANRAGARSIIVRPLCMKNPLLFIRYVAELPFRALCAFPGKHKNCEAEIT